MWDSGVGVADVFSVFVTGNGASECFRFYMRQARFECAGGEMSGMTDGDLIAIKAQFIAITSDAPRRIILYTQTVIVVVINLAGTFQIQPQLMGIVRGVVESSTDGVDARLARARISSCIIFRNHALGTIAVK